MVRRLNLDGDGQGDLNGHGGENRAVLVYQLAVTQPRVTCYRVGMRLGERRMAALLVSHRRPGFYCRVVTEGEVEAGQAIDKITAGPEGVTVAEIDALLYLPGRPRDTLTRALRIPALSPGWKRSLQQLLEHGADNAAGNSGLTGTTATPPAWPGFRPLCVTSTTLIQFLTRRQSLGAA